MKTFLLDTHTLLWYLGGDPFLPYSARVTISDSSNDIVISMASLWEIAIKHSLGKLDLPRPFEELEASLYAEGFRVLPIQVEDLKKVISLPFHHGDPFDRLIIAQSLWLDFPIIGRDEVFDIYEVQRFWNSF